MNTVNSVRMLQTVAMTVGTALLLWSVGVPTIFRLAEAASITDASDTLSNSAPSAGSNHTIEFLTPNGLSIGQNFTVEFATAFDTSVIDIGDVDLLINGSATTTQASSGNGIWGVAGFGTDILTFTTPDDMGVASSSVIRVLIGDHATVGATGDEQIVNPAATTSHAIVIGGTMQDSGEFRVAIIDQVLVTASVDTSLTFTVSGVDAATSTNNSPTTTAATSTATAIPFGTLAINVSKVLSQDLSVVTNAANGYIVTVEQTGELQSSTGADINGFIDGGYDDAPEPWVPPSAQLANPDTYGHWGITSDDPTTLRAGGEFGSDEWVAASTTPTVIMGHTGPSDGTAVNSGLARISYQIQISALQEAGDDYNTTLRYIATPTF